MCFVFTSIARINGNVYLWKILHVNIMLYWIWWNLLLIIFEVGCSFFPPHLWDAWPTEVSHASKFKWDKDDFFGKVSYKTVCLAIYQTFLINWKSVNEIFTFFLFDSKFELIFYWFRLKWQSFIKFLLKNSAVSNWL